MSQPKAMLTASAKPPKMHFFLEPVAAMRELVGPAPHLFFYFGTPVHLPKLG